MKPACLCPVCKKHSFKPRCGTMGSTCPPKPEPFASVCGIHAQLNNTQGHLLEDGEKVLFDTFLFRQGIEYDAGVFRLEKKAVYLVVWSVAADGSEATHHVRFALTVDGDIVAAPPTPISLGIISGSALFVAMAGAELALINHTNDTVRLGFVAPVANIVITKMN